VVQDFELVMGRRKTAVTSLLCCLV